MLNFNTNMTGFAVSNTTDIQPMTLHIDTDMIKLSHKELEIDFELKPDKFKNIDTIIINGYKYIKLKE